MIFVNHLPLWQRLILATLVGLFGTAVLFAPVGLRILLNKLQNYRKNKTR